MAKGKQPTGTGKTGKRTRSSRAWLDRQQRDPYVQKAQQAGQVSRAHFKLAQLDERFRLLRRGQRVLELGAAPGGWTRYIEERLDGGLLVVCDYRPVAAGADTLVVTGSYGEPATDEALTASIGDEGLDLVLSDMAPNFSGIKAVDQAQSLELMELALEAALRWLKPGGALVVKVFQGAGVDDWFTALRRHFESVKQIKPPASRAESREMYSVALGFKGAT